jgi:chromate transport protein ChrA
VADSAGAPADLGWARKGAQGARVGGDVGMRNTAISRAEGIVIQTPRTWPLGWTVSGGRLLGLTAARPVEPTDTRTEPLAHTGAVSATRLAALFLQLGCLPVGGKTIPFMFDEVVQQRGWLPADRFAEGQVLAKLLPGSSGCSMTVFVAQVLRGVRPAVVCLALYMLPGVALALAAGMFLLGSTPAPWMQGALRGIAAATMGLFLVWTAQMLPSARRARFWLPSALAAFVGNGILGIDLLLVVPLLGLLAVLCNRPGR